MSDLYLYTIKLLRFVLCGDRPELVSDIDFEKLFLFSQYHSIENIVYAALESLEIEVPGEIMAELKAVYNGAIVFDTMQELALGEISEAFNEAAIDFMPLKGSVIKHYYPMPDYRKSGDIDILVHPEDEEKIDKILLGLGYEQDEKREEYDVHSSYVKKATKEPFVEIEIHRTLALTKSRSYKFCADVWNEAELCENEKHRYCMNNEYLYVYLLSHLCHHLYEGGVGIRHLTDFYIILQQLEIDNDRLNKYLKKANLSELNKMICEIIEKWYGDKEIISSDAQTLEKIVFTSGNYGTKEIQKMMRSSSSGYGKVTLLLRKIFPPMHWLKRRYPILERRPYLAPLMWVYRFFDIFVKEKDKVSDNFEKILGNKENKVENLANIVEAINSK